MGKLIVTLAHLEEVLDGVLSGATVTFRVTQPTGLLIEDTVSGRITAAYSKNYDVCNSCGEVTIEHNRPDLPLLTISAKLE